MWFPCGTKPFPASPPPEMALEICSRAAAFGVGLCCLFHLIYTGVKKTAGMGLHPWQHLLFPFVTAEGV